MIGSTIGSYRITKLLGEGGMGAVYLATDNIERQVAIKALRPQLTHDESRLLRFRSEAIALGRLNHPNIASLFHLLEEHSHFYMVMEFVEGHTLEDLIRQNGALPPRLALDIFIDGLYGFEHAHSRGVIHRDIKASNLMISSEGTTKIMDFGIARMNGGARLTRNGQQMGTLEYMSPEQVRGHEEDARSDIYSLGILLYELLTGRVPFTDASDFELMRAHLEKAPTPARYFMASLPPAIDDIIALALAKEPEARFENVAQMREALEAVVHGLPAEHSAPSVINQPQSHPTTVTQKSKYATMLIDTQPLVDVPAPVSELSLIQKPASSGANTPNPVANKWMIPAIAGVGILIVGVLAFAALHSTDKPQSAPVRTSLTRQKPLTRQQGAISVTKQPISRAEKRSATTIHRKAQRNHNVKRPKTRRRMVREVVRSRPTKTVKRPRQQGHVDEKATLRAIIKGN